MLHIAHRNVSVAGLNLYDRDPRYLKTGCPPHPVKSRTCTVLYFRGCRCRYLISGFKTSVGRIRIFFAFIWLVRTVVQIAVREPVPVTCVVVFWKNDEPANQSDYLVRWIDKVRAVREVKNSGGDGGLGSDEGREERGVSRARRRQPEPGDWPQPNQKHGH